MGDKWHTDSRYLDSKRLDKGFGYLVIIMLEDFNKNNGCTKYVPKSHFNRERPKRNKNYNFNFDLARLGTTIINYIDDYEINKFINTWTIGKNGRDFTRMDDDFSLYVEISKFSNKVLSSIACFRVLGKPSKINPLIQSDI